MKVIVYTANIGHYDDYHNIYIKDPNVEYYYFTDEHAAICGWKNKTIIKPHEDNTKSARYFKCNPHLVLPEHDISIWIDARFKVKSKNVMKFLNSNFKKKDKIACFWHGRDWDDGGCSYIEGMVCGGGKKDDYEIILDQLLRYQKDGFPRKYGLFATGIIIRRNCEEINKFNEFWWNEIKKGSKRDQISQMYSAWKTDTKITPIEGDVRSNELVEKRLHIHKQKKSKRNELRGNIRYN